MKQVKIEKGIPLPNPDSSRRPKGPVRIAMETMEVGDSFVTDSRNRKMVGSTAVLINRRFATRKIGDNQYRIWRLT